VKVLRFLGNQAAAEDLVEAVFLDVLRRYCGTTPSAGCRNLRPRSFTCVLQYRPRSLFVQNELMKVCAKRVRLVARPVARAAGPGTPTNRCGPVDRVGRR